MTSDKIDAMPPLPALECRTYKPTEVWAAMQDYGRAVAERCARLCEAEGTDPPADSIEYSHGFIDGANDCANTIRATFKEDPR